LKLIGAGQAAAIEASLPRTGAWIETRHGEGRIRATASLPRTGAWIETRNRGRRRTWNRGRSLARERGLKPGRPDKPSSRASRSLARERGLKHKLPRQKNTNLESLPRTGAWIETCWHLWTASRMTGRSLARERGLKPVSIAGGSPELCRSLARERGLKRRTDDCAVSGDPSLPRTGAWIETLCKRKIGASGIRRSLARERGLKPLTSIYDFEHHVGRSLARERGLKLPGVFPGLRAFRSLPRTGAWIETKSSTGRNQSPSSLPRTGAWIETWFAPLQSRGPKRRSLARERGLKLL